MEGETQPWLFLPQVTTVLLLLCCFGLGWSGMAVAGRVSGFWGGATFLGARLAFLWLRALHWAALLRDERLASPQASSPLESSYCGRPAACFCWFCVLRVFGACFALILPSWSCAHFSRSQVGWDLGPLFSVGTGPGSQGWYFSISCLCLAKCRWGGSAWEENSLGKENTASRLLKCNASSPFSPLHRIRAASKTLGQDYWDVFITVVMDNGIVNSSSISFTPLQMGITGNHN